MELYFVLYYIIQAFTGVAVGIYAKRKGWQFETAIILSTIVGVMLAGLFWLLRNYLS